MLHDRPGLYFLNGMFCSYRISTDKLSRGPSTIAEPLVNVIVVHIGHTGLGFTE